MPRQYDDIVGQGEQFRPDAGEKQVGVAPGQVRSAHAAAEQHVSAHQDRFGWLVKADAAGAMPGDMEDREFRAEQVRGLFLVEEEVDRKGLHLEIEPEVEEKIPIAHHGQGVGMQAGASIRGA